MRIAIIDKLGLCYDGDTLLKNGLGGSEAAVICISKELSLLGFDVTVFNNCIDSAHSKEGIFDNVRYIDNTNAKNHQEIYDIVIVSRTVIPFVTNEYPFINNAKKKILWLHDTFIDGDQIMENLVVSGRIDHVFTLSDWHTTYILNSNHKKRRNFEVLKKYIFQTRNGAICHIPEVDIRKKDKNHFVYNSSSNKGMIPLVNDIWPEIKKRIPKAKLTIIGGYYRFKEGNKPDAQEETVKKLSEREDLKLLDVNFTGVINQQEIAKILSNAWMMLYPAAFPETFGISSLESLLYKTPIMTNRFGALEETAVEKACYLIDYSIEPNSLFPEINKEEQIRKYLEAFFKAYNDDYLHQQKQNYCGIVKDVAGWDGVALQWKEFIYKIMDEYLSLNDYKKVTRINQKVSRVFGRTNNMPHQTVYSSFGKQRRIVVVSPFRNAEKYLEKHIKSVASQNYDNYTHILIDDFSDDNSQNFAKSIIEKHDTEIVDKYVILKNSVNAGAIRNQIEAINQYVKDDDIVILLDGDDWLINNPNIFHYYNDIYDQGYEFTYGSMWSLVDNIPLIAQDYPSEVKNDKLYRSHHFNWKIPYTHLRTFLGIHGKNIDQNVFKDPITKEWMKSGADNPLFYETIERVDPSKIYCNKEIVCVYNDNNPLNDYKVNKDEQNKNANTSYTAKKLKTILLAIPTNKYIEAETMKSIFDLIVPEGYKLDFQHFHGYQIDQIRNLIADWAKKYDYLLSVDSDIVLPRDALIKMLSSDKDIITGLYIQRIPNKHTLEIYKDNETGGVSNVNIGDVPNHIFEISGCGMGCCLIKGEIFRTMEYPHFFYKSAIEHKNTVSEDIYFCKKAKYLGYTIWADPSIKCDHIGNTTYKV
jgi:glycosyltransferase involved in cell wall biosynthesis